MATSAVVAAPRPTLRYRDPGEADTLLARKLQHHLSLSRGECDVLAKALSLDVRTVQQRTILLEAGATATKLAVMLEGWACRYKALANGRRQVVAFYVPGDVCDFSIFMAPVLDSTIELIDGARVAGISQSALGLLSRSQPRITRGLWWESQAAASIQREWMVNIGQRSARERIAHLMCEIVTRLDAVGLADGRQCELPLTQAEFGDACGMTAVHTNRTLRELRDEGLAVWRNGRLAIGDWGGLSALAGFDLGYLQLRPMPHECQEAAAVHTYIVRSMG